MPVKKIEGEGALEASPSPIEASNEEGSLVASLDEAATTDSSDVESVDYLNALDSGLLELHGTIGPPNNVRKARFTLDTAASGVYISSSKAKSFYGSYLIEMSPTTINLPNGQTMVSREGLAIPYAIGNWRDFMEARVVDLQGYDVILGLS